MNIVSFIVAIFILGIIVFVHELGHFVFAKLFKVPVYEFSIGMGKRIFSFIKNNTRYSLKIFPFGGSCAMVGEDIAGSGDFTDNLGVVNYDNNTVSYDGVVFDIDDVKKNNYSDIHPLKKMMICISGPLFNFILAIICSLIVVGLTGVNLAKVSSVPEDSPARIAEPYALEANDIINNVQFNGYNEKIIFSSDLQLFLFLHSDEIRENNYDLNIGFVRDNVEYRTVLKPNFNDGSMAKIGIYLSENVMPGNFAELIYYAFNQSMSYVKSAVLSLKYLFTGRFKLNDVSGPVGTVAVIGSSISSVPSMFNKMIVILMLTNLISTNLAVMNLIPIPALDGGRLIEALVELIIGRKIDNKIVSYINIATMTLLLLFMFLIFGVDIYKIFTGAFK